MGFKERALKKKRLFIVHKIPLITGMMPALIGTLLCF
jgi:hypothetical protein